MDASTPLEEITKIHGTQIIDSLPYIDPPVDKEKVRRLILEETRNFTRKNYLENVPNVDLNVDSLSFLRQEFERVSAKKPQTATTVDLNRYSLPKPEESQQQNPTAWEHAVSNAKSQVEHQRNRITNLELLLNLGPAAWKSYVAELANLHTRLVTMLTETQQEMDELNADRKRDQTEALGNLNYLQNRFVELSFKTREIESVCEDLEKQIAILQERKKAQNGNNQ